MANVPGRDRNELVPILEAVSEAAASIWAALNQLSYGLQDGKTADVLIEVVDDLEAGAAEVYIKLREVLGAVRDRLIIEQRRDP